MLTSNPTYAAAYYTVYLFACLLLIVALQFVLRRAGALVLHGAYNSNPTFARAVCRLLDVGYYLVCLGYVTLTFQTEMPLNTVAQLIQVLTLKLGFFLLLLGALHVFNLLLLALFRRRTNSTLAAS
jgi:hypothetical protein